MEKETLKIGLAQFAPVWMDRAKTLEKALGYAGEAADAGCELVVLGGEAAIGGYPYWLELTGGAQFNSPLQKEIFAEYSRQAVCIERGDLDAARTLARARRIAIYAGIVEKPAARGESLYASLVFIDRDGEIRSVHRKLVPTYEERLVWGHGDGAGLRVHALDAFTVGGLNCWENWNPLARAALYGQGEDFHICVFPGGVHNVEVTRFIAWEARSYCASVCCVMRKEDFPADTPHLERILENAPAVLSTGGTCLAGPDGEWLIAPVGTEEKLLTFTLDHRRVREERQNLDVAGHYTRPDVLRLTVNRERQQIVELRD
ncbi:MAG: carbon-nitrogen hydrolase family protein [Acidobacteria bacterium]|nr:carbon-nitrogen hydrolase family protein [Acidobacteriota bacterium]